MLEVTHRDGAGRLATVPAPPKTLATPAILWVASELEPGQGDWHPVLDRIANPGAFLVNAFRFDAPAPAASGSQLLLPRRLLPTASMNQGHAQLELLGQDVAVLAGAVDLFRNPKRFGPALVHARAEATYARALYAPGLGAPNHLAVLAYAGVDLFDATPLSLAAAQGRYLTESGDYPASELEDPLCNCPVCAEAVPADQDERALRRHNQYAARAELGAVRNALRAGRLRELVEGRVRSDPELTALLRRLDAEADYFEERVPVQRAAPVLATSKESLQRAECQRFRRRVETRWKPSERFPLLLLLPCSHRKPYSRSRTHRAIADAVWAAGAAPLLQEAIVTSPLGLVPRELELCYPAAHYDVPVTGEWDEEEGAMIRGLLRRLLAQRSYAAVVAHLPPHTFDLVQSVLPANVRRTVPGEDATTLPAIQELDRVLREEAARLPRGRPATMMRERLEALATYQFGPEPARHLFRDTVVKGKWPTGKVFAGSVQLAMLPTERGLLSLTLAGAQRLLETRAYAVEIDDFPVKGSVFSVGVKDADPQIRVGDEVAIHHGGDLRAVGVAQMNGTEMMQLRRGEAVRVRHHA